jgi:prepilin-type processing-associated H-X9-DG protein
MRHKGFTKLEAVVVICIILILAALFFPILVRPRHHSDRIRTCRHKLKLISQAVLLYVKDYDEKYPPAVNSRHGFNKPVSWFGMIYPYFKDSNQEWRSRCPTDDAASDKAKSSYGYSAWFDARPIKAVTHPDRTIMLFEVVADANNWTQTGTGTQAVSAIARHKGKDYELANYAFADGHVMTLAPNEISDGPPERNTYTFAVR